MSGDRPIPEEKPWKPGHRGLAVVLGVTLLLGIAFVGWAIAGRPLPGVAQEASARQDGASLTPKARAKAFDGRRAFALLRRQVEVYGSRPAGSDASRRLGDDLVKRLPNGRFEAVPGGLRNIVGTLPGKGAPIVLGAHYDTEASVPGHVGANDGAAGTAAVVEIARALGKIDRGRGAPPIRFVLFDGEEEPAGTADEDFEEVALRGSKVESARNPRARAMILLDYIAERRGLSIPREGNSDRALWTRLRQAATKAGVAQVFPDEDGLTIIDDHVPFLRRGVPSIDLIDFDYPQRDTVQDDLDHVSEASLDAVGETVVQLLRRW